MGELNENNENYEDGNDVHPHDVDSVLAADGPSMPRVYFLSTIFFIIFCSIFPLKFYIYFSNFSIVT